MYRRRHRASCKEVAVLKGNLTRRKTTSGVVEMAGAAAWRSLFITFQCPDFAGLVMGRRCGGCTRGKCPGRTSRFVTCRPGIMVGTHDQEIQEVCPSLSSLQYRD